MIIKKTAEEEVDDDEDEEIHAIIIFDDDDDDMYESDNKDYDECRMKEVARSVFPPGSDSQV